MIPNFIRATSRAAATYRRASGAELNACAVSLAPPPEDARLERRRIETGRGDAVLARAVLDEAVGNAAVEDRQADARGREALAHGAAGAARHHVLLERDDRAV